MHTHMHIAYTHRHTHGPHNRPQDIVATDGVLGLMGRGLKTKILANGCQSILFTVLWRLGQDALNPP